MRGQDFLAVAKTLLFPSLTTLAGVRSLRPWLRPPREQVRPGGAVGSRAGLAGPKRGREALRAGGASPTAEAPPQPPACWSPVPGPPNPHFPPPPLRGPASSVETVSPSRLCRPPLPTLPRSPPASRSPVLPNPTPPRALIPYLSPGNPLLPRVGRWSP